MYSIDYSQLEQYVAQHDVKLIQGTWCDPSVEPCGLCLVSMLCKLHDLQSGVNSFAEASHCLSWPENLVRGLTRGFDGLTPKQAELADLSRTANPLYREGYRLGQQSLLICRTMGLLPEKLC